MNKIFRSSAVMLAVGATVLAVGIMPASAKSKSDPALANSLSINSAVGADSGATQVAVGGSSFDFPLISAALTQFDTGGANNTAWFTAYGSKNSLCGRELATGYLGTGTLSGTSGCPTVPAGGTGAIGFSDIPLLNETVATPLDSTLDPNLTSAAAAAANYVQVPVTIGGIAIIYKITFASSAPSVCATNLAKNGLILNGKTLGQIFKGTITNWNAAAIAATNKSLQINTGTKKAPKIVNCLNNLTAQTITNEDRTNGSGTTYMFSTYLTKVDSADFPAAVSTLPTPTGTVQSSSSSVLATAVGNTDGSIGYVESSYAIVANTAVPGTLSVANLVNASNKVVKCTSGTISAAANAGLKTIGGSFAPDVPAHYALVNEPGKKSYPIVGVSWAVVQKAQADKYQAQAIAQFLEFLVHSGSNYGQSNAAALSYVPLNAALAAYAEAKLETITYPTGTTPPTALALTAAN